MTGRSGGGSYTWTTAALDERIKAAAPVAGITDLRNHVCDGSVEGHCDCMFFVNTHRWDFPLNAALIAPRPLLIVNTDADNIFPLDGVNRLFAKTRRIYELHGAYDKLGLVLGPGGHNDSQNLQVPVLRWFNQHLKGTDPLVTDAATKPFAPTQLQVFDQLPADQRNTKAQEFFGEQPLEAITRRAILWAGLLVPIPFALALAAWAWEGPSPVLSAILIGGLLLFGFVFAVNSSVHSYLILAFGDEGQITRDVGFYYMANAAGRLIGTFLSGASYQFGGLPLCLATAGVMAALSWWAARRLLPL